MHASLKFVFITIINSVRSQQSTSSQAFGESLNAFEDNSANGFDVMANNDRDYSKEEYVTNIEIQSIDEPATNVYEDRRMSISLFRRVLLFISEQATSKFQAKFVHIVQFFIIIELVLQLLLIVFHFNRRPTRKLQWEIISSSLVKNLQAIK